MNILYILSAYLSKENKETDDERDNDHYKKREKMIMTITIMMIIEL